MAEDFIRQAIEHYREAGRLYRETRRLTREATRRQLNAKLPPLPAETKPWIEAAAHNAAETFRLLEKIIALGEQSEALRRHKVYALAHRNLGLFLFRRFRPDQTGVPGYLNEAVEHLTTALRLGVRKDGKVCRALGAAYYQSGKFSEAVEPLKESIEFDEKDEVARYHLCLSYLALHNREGAREQYERLKESPSSAYYHLVKILEPMMKKPLERLERIEPPERNRIIEQFRRANG